MAEAPQPRYGHWEHLAVRWTDSEAWIFSLRKKRWEKFELAEMYHTGTVLSQNRFEGMFPDLPPLPVEAFT